MGKVVLMEKWPVLGRHERAVVWLRVWADLGRAPRTMDAYARGLAEYLEMCERVEVDPLEADRAAHRKLCPGIGRAAESPGCKRGVDRLGRRFGECHSAAADGSCKAVLRLPG